MVQEKSRIGFFSKETEKLLISPYSIWVSFERLFFFFKKKVFTDFHSGQEAENMFLSQGIKKVAEFSQLNVSKSWETHFFLRRKDSRMNLTKNIKFLRAPSFRIFSKPQRKEYIQLKEKEREENYSQTVKIISFLTHSYWAEFLMKNCFNNRANHENLDLLYIFCCCFSKIGLIRLKKKM